VLRNIFVAAAIAGLSAAAFAQSYDPEKGGANVVNTPAAEKSHGTVGRGSNAIEYDSKGNIHPGPQPNLNVNGKVRKSNDQKDQTKE